MPSGRATPRPTHHPAIGREWSPKVVHAWSRAALLATAWTADRTLGDAPTALHPVGWIGRVIATLERAAPPTTTPPITTLPSATRQSADPERRRYGAAVAVALPLTVAEVGGAIADRLGGRVGARIGGRWGAEPGRTAAGGALLAQTIGQRTLTRRAREVQAALVAGDLPGARALARRHLVSRSLDEATEGHVAAATIESLAENLADATVAPLLYGAAGGARWALWHRCVNTLDAMWGYREQPYGDLGWAPARLDDAANLLPARVAAAAICLAATITDGADGRAALRAWRADARRTDSPNAGHPMAAMAGALGVRLEKPGHYILHPDHREPVAADIARARHVTETAARLVLGGLLGALVARGAHHLPGGAGVPR